MECPYFPSVLPLQNQCYIGEDPAIYPGESFRGGIGEVRLYSGADYKGHIEGVYHQHTFPGGWQSDRFPFTIDVGSFGSAEFKIEYTDFEDLEILTTVNAGEDTTFQVGNGFDIQIFLNPDFGHQAEVILNDYDKDDNIIAADTLTGITQVLIEDYYNRDNYKYMKCFVTFF